MFKYILTASAVVATSFTLSQGAIAESESAQPAKVVIYRADEPIKSERLSVTVQLDGQNIERLHSDDAVVATVPAGRHVLRGSVKGTQPLVLDLKPGQTHFVYSDVELMGSQVRLEFSEVEEQVARVHEVTDQEAI